MVLLNQEIIYLLIVALTRLLLVFQAVLVVMATTMLTLDVVLVLEEDMVVMVHMFREHILDLPILLIKLEQKVVMDLTTLVHFLKLQKIQMTIQDRVKLEEEMEVAALAVTERQVVLVVVDHQLELELVLLWVLAAVAAVADQVVDGMVAAHQQILAGLVEVVRAL